MLRHCFCTFSPKQLQCDIHLAIKENCFSWNFSLKTFQFLKEFWFIYTFPIVGTLFFFFLQILQGSFPSSVRECARTRTRLCTKFRVNFLADWFWSKKLEMIQNDKDRHTPNFHKSIMHNFKITSNAIFILFWFSLAVKVALTPHPPHPPVNHTM